MRVHLAALAWPWLGRSRLAIGKAEKLVFIKGNHAGSAGKGVDEEVALSHMLDSDSD